MVGSVSRVWWIGSVWIHERLTEFDNGMVELQVHMSAMSDGF
jgi:hypothetical protein